jgi:hypothetical protein
VILRGARQAGALSDLPHRSPIVVYTGKCDSDFEDPSRRTTVFESGPRSILQKRDAINMRIMIAGIEANAHFTMKMTIDKKGM